jgi:hypothetical protein
LLALASLDLACRDRCPDVSATFTTIAFDDSSLRWLGISDRIAEPEGPSFISRTVTHRRLDRRLLVSHDPEPTLVVCPVPELSPRPPGKATNGGNGNGNGRVLQ